MTHIVNISGGKDSQACALLAAERGVPFRLVMADTGNEHPMTVDHAHYIADFVGVPLETVRADFTARIAAKRVYVATKWHGKGVPDTVIDLALSALNPTGNPFLDLCIWKGRFPSRRAQFCTTELKTIPIEEQVILPALHQGNVVQWLGVRRDESRNRANAPMFQRVRRDDATGNMLLFRPIIHWTAENAIGYSAARGARHNPLYMHGMRRVGCFPCINANKAELAQIARRFPEAVEKLCRWEAFVAAASKRGRATFFASDVTPQGAAMGKAVKAGNMDADDASWPTATEVMEWARTTRGGKQFDLLHWGDDGLSCSSEYGLCE